MRGYSDLSVEPGLHAPVYGYGSYSRGGGAGSYLARQIKRFFAFFNGYEWLELSSTFVCLGIAAYSLQRAKWIASQPALVPLLGFAILSTAILTKVKLGKAWKVAIVLVLGLLVVFWQSARLAGDQSLPAALMTAPNGGTIHFGVFLIALTWGLGVFSIWYVLRKKNAWVPAGLGTAIVLVNLSNLPPEHYSILPVFLVSALAFVGLSHFAAQRKAFSDNGGRYPVKGSTWFLVSIIAVSSLAVAGSSMIPSAGIDRVGFDASGQLISSVQKNWLNIFASVPGKWNILRSEDMGTLSFSSPLDTRETVLFVVDSEAPAYWRINRYDTYNSWGWTSYAADEGELLKAGTERTFQAPATSQTLTYAVESRSKTDLLLLTGELISATVPVEMRSQSAGALWVGPDTDVVSVTTPDLLQPYQRYTATVSVSSATPAQLAAAGTDYPSWVTSGYLQMPSSFSSRVRQLAQRLTAGISAPYDKAIAIEKYVQTLNYNIDAKSPSRRGDEVDSFLFVQKEGVCTDFATAMAVMLRSVGVPTRLATGYLPGEHDEATNTYVIRGKDYHAWPEVYFPQYGWIGFEPTPGPGTDLDLAINGSSDSYQDPMYPEEYFYSDAGGYSVPIGSLPKTPKQNIILPIVLLSLLGAGVIGIMWTIGSRLYGNLRMSASAGAVYAKMCRFASMVGVGPSSSETPFEYCHRLSTAIPEGAQSIDNIGLLYAESSFSPRKDLNDDQLSALRKAWVALYPILFKRRLPWNR